MVAKRRPALTHCSRKLASDIGTLDSNSPVCSSRDDLELFRWLRPCDPVITVADDVVFFECFSADESSYGCLTVSRNAFGPSSDVSLGTTNVDYSWDLYNHFQAMRPTGRRAFW